MAKLNVEVVVGLVNRLSAPLRRLQQDVGQISAKMTMAGAGAAAFGAGLLLPLQQAVSRATELSSALTSVGIVADASSARMAAIRPELRKIAETTNQFVPDLAQGLKDLTGKGLALDAALAALPAIAKTATAADASMVDMSAAASALIGNLGIVPAQLQKTLDILTVAGNAGAFELRDMAREFPALTGAMKALGMQGEGSAASIGAALQVAMKMAGSASEAANNVSNFLGHLTSPTTVEKMKKVWGVDFPAMFKQWQVQGLNPVEESLALIQRYAGDDQFKLSQIFEDVQTIHAIQPLLQNIEEYRRIRDQALAGAGAADAQFARRTGEDPAQRWRALSIQVGNLTDRMGQALTPVLLKVVAALRPVIDRLAAWIDANPALASGIALSVAGLGALSATAGALLLGMGPLLFVVVRLTGATRLLGRALLLTPIGRVISLIGGAIWVLTHWQETIAAVGHAWDWLIERMGRGGRDAWQHVLQIADDLFFAPLKAMFAWLDDLLGGWPGRALAYGRKLIGSLVQGIKDAWRGMIDWLRSLDILPDWVKRLLGIGAPPAAAPATTAPASPVSPAALPPVLPHVIVPPQRSIAEAAAMAERLALPPRLAAAAAPRTLGSRLQGWLSGLPGSVLAGTMAATPAVAATGPTGPRPAPIIQMPITITIQTPSGADEQRIAALARRAVEEATSQAGRRIAALYDGSDL